MFAIKRCVAVLLVLCLCGCGESGGLFDGDLLGGGGAGGNTSNQFGGYTIALEGYVQAYHDQVAQQQVATYKQQTGLSGFWADSRGDKSYVCYGRYRSADEARGSRDMAKLKQLATSGRIRPSLMTVITYELPAAGEAAAMYHIGRAPSEAVYTLLASVYDEAFKGDRREAAEREVLAWRAQGREAFFSHTAADSSVLLGLFHHGAFVQNIDAQNRVTHTVHPMILRWRQELGVVQLKRNGEPAFVEGGVAVETELIRVPGR